MESTGTEKTEKIENLSWDFQFDDEDDDEFKIEKIPKREHCVLIYDDDGEGERQWKLKEGDKIFLGRSNGIGVGDKRLSRKQVECHVDFDEMKVVVTRIGKHPSLDQRFRPIGAGSTVEVSHLDTFWLLDEKYPIYVFIEAEKNIYGKLWGHDCPQNEPANDDLSESEESGICSGDDA